LIKIGQKVKIVFNRNYIDYGWLTSKDAGSGYWFVKLLRNDSVTLTRKAMVYPLRKIEELLYF
jgi:hypothetical protein